MEPLLNFHVTYLLSFPLVDLLLTIFKRDDSIVAGMARYMNLYEVSERIKERDGTSGCWRQPVNYCVSGSKHNSFHHHSFARDAAFIVLAANRKNTNAFGRAVAGFLGF